ncbi:hypothetical protein HQ563_14130, partial [bacterium]|nr:hypothetical protein [bacterium]
MRPWQLDDWITTLEDSLRGSPAEGQPTMFIYGAPYSGSFIPWLTRKESPRAIITSSDANELPVTGPEEESIARQGDFFVLKLFENLWQGRHLTSSFERATVATHTFTRNMDGNGLSEGLAYPDLDAQHPRLDDNGDGIGSFGFLSGRPGQDGFLSAHIFLGYGKPQPEAQIIGVPGKQLISVGEYPDLWAKVADRDLVEAVWMVIKPPLFSLGSIDNGSSFHRDVEGIHVPLFEPDRDGMYFTTDYPEFSEVGTYRVLFFVKDKSSGQLGEVRETKVVVLDPAAPEPGGFSILSPEEGDTVGTQVLLKWSESQKWQQEDEITYTLQIATDPFFENIVFEKNDIEGTSLLIGEDAGLLDRTTYYWRVKAENFFGKARFALANPMRSTDIGQSVTGETNYDRATDSYVIQGNGLGSFGEEDHFRFVHTSAKGSFEVSARLDYLNGTEGPALAGVMIRASTDPGSPYTMIAINPDGEVFFGFRRAPGSSSTIDQCGTALIPGHVKLVCARLWPNHAAEITPYFSVDGKTWFSCTPITLQIPNEVQVGICVTSGDPEHLVKAVVNDFTISPLTDGESRSTKSSADESSLSSADPPIETLGNDYSTFKTDYGAGLPGYNVLTVLVYNQNDPSQSPPGTTITITPIVGTINNWMYSGYLPVGDYTIDVTAPDFSSEKR